ncbi:ArdC-like ssDNA-binding domain-containing protein [Carnobacterium mobile]|uniref:ArdC-like ssDNA-binding domain-containing protein n=1 Tax=Carnobacterium mobile TaxID=2750 RepID=UPI0018664225|nr:ArdC-like ssDNA-binding domain-containing protein [Carnobacterium mobile]
MVKRSREEKKKQIDELTDKMNHAVKQFQNDPQDELELLNSMTKFKNYSTRNVLLIQSQYKGAYGVASYKEFQKMGYQVQKGEKSLYLLAPKIEKTFKNEKGNKKLVKYANAEQQEKIETGQVKTKKEIVGYLTVPVFDITQTNCPVEDYPKLYPNRPENFDFNNTEMEFKDLSKALSEYAKEKEITVKMGKTSSAAKGFYAPFENEIVLKDCLNDTERTKVLLHELAHAEMHNIPKMKEKDHALHATNVLEYQAEMTAYVVSNTFGLNSEEYTQSYLANWTRRDVEKEVYIKSLEEVKEVAANMIEKITDKYNEKLQSKEKTQDVLNAEKLNFLSDSNGKNHYIVLKDEPLICTGIEDLNTSKFFTDFNIRLEDKEQNKYYYCIRSDKNRKEIAKEWSGTLTGKEWLSQDIKNEVLNRKPNLNIQNKVPEDTDTFKTISEYTQQKKVNHLNL